MIFYKIKKGIHRDNLLNLGAIIFWINKVFTKFLKQLFPYNPTNDKNIFI
jgi:hypothetical protein